MVSQGLHGPNRRAVAQPHRVLGEFAPDGLVGDDLGGRRPPGSRPLGEVLDAMVPQILREPPVDAAPTGKSDLGRLGDRATLGDQEDRLQATEGTRLGGAAQSLRQPRAVEPSEAEFGWTFGDSHSPGVTRQNYSCKDFWLPT
jgi:hypothetical protein